MNKIISKIKHRIISDKKVLTVSLCFSIFCVIFGLYIYQDYYIHIYKFGPELNFGTKVYIFQIVNSVADFFILILFSYCLFTSRAWSKIFMLTLLILCMATELGYVSFYSRFSDGNDLLIAKTATSEQVLDMAYQYLNYRTFVILLAFIISLIVLKNKKRRSSNWLMPFVLFLFIGHSVFNFLLYRYLSTKHTDITPSAINENLFIPLPIGITTLLNSGIGYLVVGDADFRIEREKLDYKSETKPENNIVIIIEETMRGDHLSLNGYYRPTSKYLDQLRKKKILKNFGIAVSGSTLSLTSNNLLFAGVIPSSENKNITKETFRNPSIFQYAKASNYKTYFLDGQKVDYWAGTFDDYKYIDEFVHKRKLLPDESIIYNIDFKIAERINHIISNSTGNLIYVIKRGFHSPYESNYPANKKTWAPVFDGDISTTRDRRGLVNSYDNSLVYNLDTFFKILIGDPKKSLKHSIIIYTGDHGESFLEDGKTTGHSKKNKLQATVPLVLIGENLKVDTLYKASHHNILPTILDLIKYPENKIHHHYSPSLLKAKSTDNVKRQYMLPNLNNPKIYDFD